MTDITKTIRAFHFSSGEVWDDLQKAGYQPGDDEWHEAMNNHFQESVCRSLEIDLGVYAFYTADGESQNRIQVATGKEDPVLVGKLEGNSRSWTWISVDSSKSLEFRELSHPYDWQKKPCLDWVYCEEVATKDHVCIPIDNAIFMVNGS